MLLEKLQPRPGWIRVLLDLLPGAEILRVALRRDIFHRIEQELLLPAADGSRIREIIDWAGRCW